jgi:molecular chaperone DnaK
VHLLIANKPLPADAGSKTFSTVFDNQHEVKLEVCEQTGSIASEELRRNAKLVEGRLCDLPHRPARAPFQFVFHMTETGLLQVHAWEAESRQEVRFEIQIGSLDGTRAQQATSALAYYEVSG